MSSAQIVKNVNGKDYVVEFDTDFLELRETIPENRKTMLWHYIVSTLLILLLVLPIARFVLSLTSPAKFWFDYFVEGFLSAASVGTILIALIILIAPIALVFWMFLVSEKEVKKLRNNKLLSSCVNNFLSHNYDLSLKLLVEYLNRKEVISAFEWINLAYLYSALGIEDLAQGCISDALTISNLESISNLKLL